MSTSTALQRSSPSPPSPASSKHRPPFRKDIEGLRGIAVLLVVLYHAGVPGFTGGYVGVDVFFVLSGYLITGILMAEAVRTGTIDLPRFYARRARRLLPAMAVLLVAVAAFSFTFYAPAEQESIAETAMATAAYVSNFHFAAGATNYYAADAETNPLLHTWSLSVEEQFYFVWPALVLLALAGVRRRVSSSGAVVNQRRLVWAMVVVSVASFALTVYLMETLRTHWAFYASPARAWEFAIGGLGALVPRLSGEGLSRGRIRFGSLNDVPPAGRALGWLGLAAVLVAGTAYDARTSFPGVAALLPAFGTILILRGGTAGTETALAKMLAWRPLQELGRLSYSWYLWHWPVLVFAAGTLGHLSLGARLAFAAGSLVLAEGSYRLVENPVRHHRLLRGRNSRGLALAAVLTASGVALPLGWKYVAAGAAVEPSQLRYTAAISDFHAECIDLPIEEAMRDCVFGDPGAEVSAVLIGDSHANSWLPPLVEAARARGWRLYAMMNSSCPLVDEPVWDDDLSRFDAECEAWREEALDKIAEIRPDFVVATMFRGYEFTDEQWVEGTSRALGEMAQASEHVVFIRDVPRAPFDVPQCLSRAEWRGQERSCTYSRYDKYYRQHALLSSVVSRLEGVTEVDMNDHLCRGAVCDAERDGVVTLRDGHHLTAAFATSLAPALTAALEDVVGNDHSDSQRVEGASAPRQTTNGTGAR